MNNNNKNIIMYLYLLLFSFLFLSPLCSAVDFIFNSFNSTTSISLYGNATIQSNILTLTDSLKYQTSRALYPHKIPMKKDSSNHLLPFSTSFIFAMEPTGDGDSPGHGFVFLFSPVPDIQNESDSEYLGLVSRKVDGNSSNHVFGVEFDVFQNKEFYDINSNHIGIDVNSLKSVLSTTFGYYPDGDGSFKRLLLNNGQNYQVWIEYKDFRLSVHAAPVGVKKPNECLICMPLNLSDVFEDEMYVGFSSATGTLAQIHKILRWSFSNSDDPSWSDGLITEDLLPALLDGPSNGSTTGFKFILGLSSGIFFFMVTSGVVRFIWIRSKKRRLARENPENEMEEEHLDQMPGLPTRFSYEELVTATHNFSKKLGQGGFGSVFEGSLIDGSKIAVKCLEGLSHLKKSFLAEVQSIGSIHHVNLVRLRGFCTWKSQRFLVYDFMSNGSLDRWIYHGNKKQVLDWKCRKKIILDIAKGLAYLHEECRQKIIHLDIKPQNILLDDDFNAKVSDFGLSKLMDRNETKVMTTMRGTPGYLAPEWLSSVITEKVDVYSFGIVILEILCGRKNFDRSRSEESWQLLCVFEKFLEQEKLLDMIDNSEDMQTNASEVIEMMKMASWCLQTDYTRRPSMSTVVKVLEGGRNIESNLDHKFTDPVLQKNISQENDLTTLLPSIISGPRKHAERLS